MTLSDHAHRDDGQQHEKDAERDGGLIQGFFQAATGAVNGGVTTEHAPRAAVLGLKNDKYGKGNA